jgi:tRNA A-37 threonylcarbamoyl transferase component Bud32
MAEMRRCPECAAELPVGAPEGLCPQCLIWQGTGEGRGAPSNRSNDQTLAPRINDSGGAPPGVRVRFFGDYEILEEIARGGMGVVYKARQISLDRIVALKMILAGQFASEADIERFYTEARAAANLQHPNIVAIHEVGQRDGQHYYTMDFVAGKNLAQLADGKPLPADRAAAYVKTIAEAVHFAHQRGTLHRDLKPQNILIDADDRPRITDFGLAKRSESDSHLTRTGDVLGSPSYMPPEQADWRPAEIGPQSDVYSLGAILYELLSGRPPFRGATTWETLAQVIQAPPAALRKINRDAPQDLETVCQKCLEKRPERRYASARSLAEELGRFLNREPIQARPVSAARRASFWAQSHPWAITSVATAAVIGLTLLSCGLWAENRYLVWRQTHPEYVRAPGRWTERLVAAYDLAAVISVVSILAYAIYQNRQRRGWRGIMGRQARALLLLPPRGPLLRYGFTLLGGLSIVYSFAYAAILIEAYIWEGSGRTGDLFELYVLLWVGARLFIWASSDLFTMSQSASALSLPPEELEAVRQMVLSGNVAGAVKRCQRGSRGASLSAAWDVVAKMAVEIEAEHPGQIAAGARTLYRLRPQRLLIGSLLATALLGLALNLLPAAIRVPWGLQFAGSLALGAAAIATRRISRRFWIPLFLGMGLFIAVMVGSASHFQYHLSLSALLCGGASGLAVMARSIAKRRDNV